MKQILATIYTLADFIKWFFRKKQYVGLYFWYKGIKVRIISETYTEVRISRRKEKLSKELLKTKRLIKHV